MKLLAAVALALSAVAPTVASATVFSIDFEKDWAYGTEVQSYYAGGTASDGTTGPNAGVTFVNVSGLSNDADFTYYSGAPSARGVAYAFSDTASFLNVASGVSNALAFYYASPIAIVGAIQAYSGLNGTGSLLGSVDLAASGGTFGAEGLYNYDGWSLARLGFSGVARSFALGNSTVAAFDNVATVPEPGTTLMLLIGALALATSRVRRKRG